jgi:very-short-patch-repair endonuclease
MAMRWGKLYRGTPAELSLEEAVCCLGVPYRTQFPGYLFGFRYFPDFFLPTLGLVIEVDDASHDRSKKREEDEERTRDLESRGWRVVRCTNEEALADPHGAVKRMLLSVNKWPPRNECALVEGLPKPKKATQKNKRAARSAAIRARRVNKRRQGDEWN